jgi:hypothetical protein
MEITNIYEALMDILWQWFGTIPYLSLVWKFVGVLYQWISTSALPFR